MSTRNETYEGRDITIEDDKILMINDKEIDYEHELETDKWFSRYLPYTVYDSLDELAKAIISNTSEFESRS